MGLYRKEQHYQSLSIWPRDKIWKWKRRNICQIE